MEQKKILWIIAASGVFLLVVIGAALILNSTSSSPASASITTIEHPADDSLKALVATEPVYTDPSGTFGTVEPVIQNSEKTDDSNVISNTQIADFNVNAATSDPVNANNAGGTEIQLTSPQVTGVAATSKAGEDAIAAADAKKAGTAAPKPVATTTAKKTAAPAPKKIPDATKTTYWVQTASYTNKKMADNARSVLDQNKIPAEIFTYKDPKDNLFYRVRVGPYTTKSEAEYWKGRIVKIDLFKDSQCYVTETTSK